MYINSIRTKNIIRTFEYYKFLIKQEQVIKVDNYLLFLIDVAKENAEVPAIDNANTQYKIAYELWRLDDGSEENWKHIESIAWYVTEKLKP